MKLIFDILNKEINNLTAHTDVKMKFWIDERNLYQFIIYFDDRKIIHCICEDVDEFNKYTSNILAKLEKAGVDVNNLLDSFGHM